MEVFSITSMAEMAEQVPTPIVARYKLYGGAVELLYNDEEHTYGTERDGVFVPAAGVTSVTGTLHKPALVAWSAKMTVEYMISKLKEVAYLKDNDPLQKRVPDTDFDQMTKWLFEAKANYRKISEAALDVGHIAHEWIEVVLKDLKVGIIDIGMLKLFLQDPSLLIPGFIRDLPENEKAANCVKAALQWIINHNVRPVWVEKKIYSRLWNYAGTFDLVAIMDSCDDVNCCGRIDPASKERIPVRFKDERCLADWKSSSGMYNEYRLQTASYKEGWEEEFPDQPMKYRFVVKMGKEDGKLASYLLTPEDHAKDFGAFIGLLSAYERMNEIDQLERQAKDVARQLEKARKEAEKEAEKVAKLAAKAAKAAAKSEAARKVTVN